MTPAELFDKLVQAETEDAVEALLTNAGYMGDDESMWHPLGDFENNFAAVGNQQSDPTAALIEKIINSIDAVLMAKSFEHGVDPQSSDAPPTMAAAVERFFGVRDGRISNLTAAQRRELSDHIHVVAVGSKTNPNLLIIDRGEGQTPAKFPDTFLSIMKSNKMRIPFVQGKFNSGGLGILQFCGNRNFQLIASRRHPAAPVEVGDPTGELWGFTIVRRLRPTHGRRNSVYVYLAPGGAVPSFSRPAIRVLPGPDRANRPGEPYALDLPYGTCLKLYGFRWRMKTIITLDGRYELERLLHVPALPFRLDETRPYSAHSYSSTVSGGWDSATTGEDDGGSTKLEEGFPAYAALDLEGIGALPYQIAVYKEGTKKRRVPYGVFFTVNGQVHGSLPTDFVSRRLRFDYLKDDRGPLLVTVDCTNMDSIVREDFFMASRDRVRRNDVYAEIEAGLAEELGNHPGLQAINQQRRQKELERPLDEDASLGAFQRLLDGDPSLASLFAAGDRLVTTTGPAAQTPFVGRRIPAFFRLAKEPKGGLVKSCPVNRTCHIEFETDAVNDYFMRLDSPGTVTIDPPNLLERQRLWNGEWDTRFRVPWDAEPGDEIAVTVTVNDVEREMRGVPFVSTFVLRATSPVDEVNPPGPSPRNRSQQTNGNKTGVALALPRVKDVSKAEWESYTPPFHAHEAMRIRHDGLGGFDYFVNVDNAFLLTELTRASDETKPQVRFWFEYGLVLAAVGMIKHQRSLAAQAIAVGRNASHDAPEAEEDLDQVNEACNGLARVIVPLIGSLGRSTLIP
jgi:hypothetical protein